MLILINIIQDRPLQQVKLSQRRYNAKWFSIKKTKDILGQLYFIIIL